MPARSLTLAALAAAALAAPAATASEPACFGTEQTLVLCVDPTAGPALVDDCVYAGPPPCIPVLVNSPQVSYHDTPMARQYIDDFLCVFLPPFAPGLPPYVAISPDGPVSGILVTRCWPYPPD